MRWNAAAAAILMVSLLAISGCATSSSPGNGQRAGASIQGGSPPESLGEPASFAITGIQPDKTLYHSAEVMSLDVSIESDGTADNVTVSAKGINGRMDLQKSVSLAAGLNVVQFQYQLPRCNVCGGISAGRYELTCEARLGNSTAANATAVDIVQ